MNHPRQETLATLHPSPEFEEFRELLLSNERQSLSSLDRRVEDIRQPNAIGDRLPEAILHSVKNDRGEMAAALFPILGPAIRLYVNELFKGLIDQINTSVENATSIQRYRWRWEAKRAGVPFSEYVLLKTLNYRMDEVLLIDPKSGLLMQRVTRGPDSPMQSDPDLVSGMLAAIRSFAKDTLAYSPDFSPGNKEEPELERFSFGDYEIFVEAGPNGILAVIGTGTPPANFRDLLAEVSESLHAQFSQELQAFEGNPFSLAETDNEMERLLIENKTDNKKASMWPVWAVVSSLALGLVGWAGFSMHRSATWQAGIEAVRSTPGIEVLEVADARGWRGGKTLHLLKDPQATDPGGVLAAEIGELAQKAEFRVSPYLSMEPQFVEAREILEKEKRAVVREEIDKAGEGIRIELAAEKADLQRKLDRIDVVLGNKSEVDSSQLTWALFDNRFGEFGARISKRGKTWHVVGSVLEPYFSEIRETTTDLVLDGGNLDFTELKPLAPPRVKPEFERRSETIMAYPIEFPSGKAVITSDVQIAFETVIGKIRALDEWSLERGKGLPFYEIHALPVIGENTEENKAVERARLGYFQKALVRTGISEARITLRHDVRPITDRSGLYVRALRTQPILKVKQIEP